jgi:hypothetical protein
MSALSKIIGKWVALGKIIFFLSLVGIGCLMVQFGSGIIPAAGLILIIMAISG